MPHPALKFVVISLGLVLIGGFMWVIGVVISRATSDAPATSPQITAPMASLSECAEITFPHIPQHRLYNAEPKDGGWTLFYSQLGTVSMIWLRLDACGNELQRAHYSQGMKVEKLPTAAESATIPTP